MYICYTKETTTTIMSYFKETFTFGFLLAIATFKGYAQTSNTSLLPYNPDIDGSGTIEATD